MFYYFFYSLTNILFLLQYWTMHILMARARFSSLHPAQFILLCASVCGCKRKINTKYSNSMSLWRMKFVFTIIHEVTTHQPQKVRQNTRKPQIVGNSFDFCWNGSNEIVKNIRVMQVPSTNVQRRLLIFEFWIETFELHSAISNQWIINSLSIKSFQSFFQFSLSTAR